MKHFSGSIMQIFWNEFEKYMMLNQIIIRDIFQQFFPLKIKAVMRILALH
jgi:hypothetical protein